MVIFDATSRLLADMIQGTSARHRVLASNLANAETPGYQAQDVTFSAALESARAGAAGPLVTMRLEAEPGVAVRQDGNTVDLDRQMVKLAQNTGWHNTMLQILNSRLAVMRQAIQNRG
jgi:flagellar basal-body rod protein FlgB